MAATSMMPSRRRLLPAGPQEFAAHGLRSRERSELEASPAAQQRELAAICVARSLEPTLAQQVAQQLMVHGALGAALPLAVAAWAPQRILIVAVSAAALALLGLLGGIAARTDGARMRVGAWRVSFWGALAMVIAAGVGALFGSAV